MELQKYTIDNRLSKSFAIATITWGAIGMLVGVIIAFQLAFPSCNLGIEYTTFGRVRPLHTNAVIFAFVGNGIFTAVYYSMPRLLKTSMWSPLLGKIHFWGWQLIIVAAAITLPMGFSSSKEYAELEWPIDIAITVVWVVFGINMIGTILTRRERHLYVAIWFFLASWVTVAMLHVVNSFEIPVSFFKSYSWYEGVEDALVQWWYGHNAVAFFLTTPYLGLMYYFLPKAANRPIYSYRLSIVHFWSLIFIYIWAGPHHLLYTALPGWAQALGTTLSIMLILPSWGGMLNGLFTLRGAWDKVREDPVLKFYVLAVICYGMATFEGPMMSLKSVNAISHYSDWTIAHVHIGALGWNGFLTFGMLYWLIPRLYKTKLFSTKLASTHFLIGTLGIVLYAVPMYWSAFRTFFMMSSFTPEGQLQYQFIDVVQSVIPFYILRAIGGTIYLTGVIIMIYNLVKTAKQGSFEVTEEREAPALAPNYVAPKGMHWHSLVERKPIMLLVLSLIRPFRYEVARYGEYSKAGEFVYDHPYQWGSKRTGPDLARIGGKYPDSWHFNHMLEPTSMAPGSVMPPYPWLFEKTIDIGSTNSKIHAMRKMGVPYPNGYEAIANEDLKAQANKIVASLKREKITIGADKQIVALIAYLQRVGKDIKAAPKSEIESLTQK